MASTLLNVSALSAGTEDKPILHEVDLAVGAGECHVLMGPNGAGKSTLGHVIMGDPAYRVTGGRIEFDGADVTELSADKRSLAGICSMILVVSYENMYPNDKASFGSERSISQHCV